MTRDSSARWAVSALPVAAEQFPGYSGFFRREFPKVVRTVYLVVRDLGRAEELSQVSAALENWTVSAVKSGHSTIGV